MTIESFITLAKGCKTKAELYSLAKSNGINLKGNDLDVLFKKISDGKELNDESLESAAGGSTYGISSQQLKDFIYKK